MHTGSAHVDHITTSIIHNGDTGMQRYRGITGQLQSTTSYLRGVKLKEIIAPSRVERLACMDHVSSSSKVSHVNSSSNVFTLDPTSSKF